MQAAERNLMERPRSEAKPDGSPLHRAQAAFDLARRSWKQFVGIRRACQQKMAAVLRDEIKKSRGIAEKTTSR